ncbi:MAG: hypothetical protein Hens3KO_28730 [Henriciella sp.]
MITKTASTQQTRLWLRWAKSPAAVLFLSANIANAANLAFNMVFARLMGPDLFSDLALLLTLKLAALSLFSAVQLGFSKIVGAGTLTAEEQTNTIAMATRLSFKLCIPICIVLFASAQWLGSLFSISNTFSVLVIILTVPALVPISLYRGAAYGRVDLPRVVFSFQFEWIVRFLGCLLMWQAGAGLTGIAAALVASVYVGMLFASNTEERFAWMKPSADARTHLKTILAASGPFLALQFAQILILDGDLFIAKAVLPAEQAGYLAALGLVQRIFFFAFLSFAALLLPLVARKVAEANGTGAKKELINMLIALFGLASFPLLVLSVSAPFVCSLLFGDAFGPMAKWAPYAAISAFSFTLLHLIVTYHVARNQIFIAFGLAGFAFAEILILSIAANLTPDIGSIIMVKFFIMVLTAAAAILITLLGEDR